MANDGRVELVPGGAAAQDADRLDAARGGVPVEGRIGATVCGAPPEEPPVACVDARTDDLPGTTLAPRPVGRGRGEGGPGLPAFATAVSGILAAAGRGGCFVPDARNE